MSPWGRWCITSSIEPTVGRPSLRTQEAEYAAFEQVLAEAAQRVAIRVLAYCVMPNHWHLVLWPRANGDLSRCVGWLTLTHTQRWHVHHHTTGTGHLYQGRFTSFPIQTDEHLLTVCRYVERNPMRAKVSGAFSLRIAREGQPYSRNFGRGRLA